MILKAASGHSVQGRAIAESRLLTALGSWLPARSSGHEIVVRHMAKAAPDSSDRAQAIEGVLAHRVVVADPSVEENLYQITTIATGDVLVFVDVDFRPDASTLSFIDHLSQSPPIWGWFRLDPSSCPLPWVARYLNVVAGLTRLPEPESGFFVHRHLLNAVGGIDAGADSPLAVLVRKLRRIMHPQSQGALAASELTAFNTQVGARFLQRLSQRVLLQGPRF